ncbi:ATP-binding protein [Pollutibacter soli]|uniref:ATP-binding protein n=1 Tax=Pollutibacter soli TaxID=3034157 RepID=UPI003013E50F
MVLTAILVFSLFTTPASAQPTWAPLLRILSDTTYAFRLPDSAFQIFPDKEDLSISEITKGGDQLRFVPINSITTDQLKTRNWWVRYRIGNDADSSLQISLGAFADLVTWYTWPVGKPSSVTIFKSGSALPWMEKDGFKDADLVPINIPAHSEMAVYGKIQFKRHGLPSEFALAWFSTEKMIAEQFFDHQSETIEKEAFSKIFFAGFFLLAALFYLVLFAVIKEKEYGYLALFLFFLFIQMNPYFSILLARDYPVLAQRISEAGLLYTLFFFQFTRSFFNTKVRFPRGDKWLRFINIVYASSVFAGVIWNGVYWLESTRSILFCAGILVYTVILFRLLKKKDNESRLFLKALLPFISCFLLFLLSGFLYIVFIALNINTLDPFFEWLGNWANHLYHFSVSWAILFFAYVLFRRYDHQRKKVAQQALEKEILAREKEKERNALIARQKIELEEQVALRTAELHASLEELKTTQHQLIHAEKMASLGELTSGIAHEIQNPLNFVNNFSEINAELVEELKTELGNGDYGAATLLAGEILDNEARILHHGKRADNIVKGMLQHSRKGIGKKESTDLEQLCNEYLRLSLHGMRARYPDFHIQPETNFDPLTGKLNVIPQELGQAIFNILNNAYYACAEKIRISASETLEVELSETAKNRNKSSSRKAGSSVIISELPITVKNTGSRYIPRIELCTSRNREFVDIRIRDNGTGIPQHLKDKIYQPFFTTKPTGEGTGLGLSLAYDIITRGHNGELTVESIEGEFSEFIIRLPA